MPYSYFTKKSLDGVFEEVKTNYTRQEEVPQYEVETLGIQKLLGVLEGAQMDMRYPSLLDKATHLFLQINKGHFFSNGNKRLALVVALGFLALNDTRPKRLSRKKYQKKLTELFDGVQFEEYPEFGPEEFGFYHLSLIVAESHKYVGDDFDSLKKKVNDFFAFAVDK